MALAPLYPVHTVIKTKLTPNTPAPLRVPAQGKPLYMHGLIEQLKVVPLSSQRNMLQGQFAYSGSGKKMHTNATKGKQREHFSKAKIQRGFPRLT